MTPNQYVRDCREKAGMTQGELASRLGIELQAVSAWERGKTPVPRNRVLQLRKHIGLHGTTLVDLMLADYRAKLVAAIKNGAKP